MDRHAPILCTALVSVISLLVLVPATHAQDIVYVFSDGSINRVEGTILQEVAGGDLRISTNDGNEIEVAAGDVANIIRGTGVLERSQVPIPSIAEPRVPDIADRSGNTSPATSPMSPPIRYRDPGVAFLCSLLVPGGGQFYNGDASGFVFLGGAILGGVLIAQADPLSSTFDRDILVGGSVAFMSGLMSMIMAPMEAARLNRKNGFHAHADVSSGGTFITLAYNF